MVAGIETAPFAVTEHGWGEFSINIKVYFHDAREQAVSVTHDLRLFHSVPGGTGPGE